MYSIQSAAFLLLSFLVLFSAPIRAQGTLPETTCYNPFGTAANDISGAVGNTTNCYAMVENEIISTANLSVYHFGNFFGNASLYLSVVNETAQQVLPLYASFLGNSQLLNLRVHVTRFQSNNNEDYRFATSWIQDEYADTCYIEVETVGYSYSPAEKSLRAESKLAFQNALAFQLYRCVQLRSGLYRTPDRYNTTKEFSRWWYDGSAEYFAGIFYPEEYTFSHFIILDSIPGLVLNDPPTGAINMGYFFLHLSNMGWIDLAIHQWVSSQKFTEDGIAELTRMAADVRLVEAFPSLIERFIDQLTTLRDGSQVKNYHQKKLWQFSSEYIEDQVHDQGFLDIEIFAKAFDDTLYPQLNLVPGQVFSATFQHDPWSSSKGGNIFIQWRRNNETAWKRLDYNQTIEVRGDDWGSVQNTTYTFLPIMMKPIFEKGWGKQFPYILKDEYALLRLMKPSAPRRLM
jgi:hypothetical protein